MSNSGSSDCLNDEQRLFLVTILQQSLEEWKDGFITYKLFDDAVKNLIGITLQESK